MKEEYLEFKLSVQQRIEDCLITLRTNGFHYSQTIRLSYDEDYRAEDILTVFRGGILKYFNKHRLENIQKELNDAIGRLNNLFEENQNLKQEITLLKLKENTNDKKIY